MVFLKEMVNTEIPKNYTASPSSLTGTPHLTINREVAFDLDSSNAFEGRIKLEAYRRQWLIGSQGLKNS